MKRTEVKLSNGQTVGGYQSPTPGLVVAKSPASNMWDVIHAPSGMYVSIMRTRSQAERVAAMLGGNGDWTRSAHDIIADAFSRARAVEVIRTARKLFAIEEHAAAAARAARAAKQAS